MVLGGNIVNLQAGQAGGVEHQKALVGVIAATHPSLGHDIQFAVEIIAIPQMVKPRNPGKRRRVGGDQQPVSVRGNLPFEDIVVAESVMIGAIEGIALVAFHVGRDIDLVQAGRGAELGAARRQLADDQDQKNEQQRGGLISSIRRADSHIERNKAGRSHGVKECEQRLRSGRNCTPWRARSPRPTNQDRRITAAD